MSRGRNKNNKESASEITSATVLTRLELESLEREHVAESVPDNRRPVPYPERSRKSKKEAKVLTIAGPQKLFDN